MVILQTNSENAPAYAVWLLAGFLILFSAALPAQDGALDQTFNPGVGFSDRVEAIALQHDGKLIAAGVFTHVNGAQHPYLARLNADGSQDSTFNVGGGPNDVVLALAVQPDGRILIGGRFESFNGVVRRRIARLHSDGSVDTSFNPGNGPNNMVQSVSLQPDGKVLVGGWFTSVSGSLRLSFARLNADGSLDTSFNTGSALSGVGSASAWLPGGHVIVGSWHAQQSHLRRLTPNGQVDSGFNIGTGPDDGVYDIARLPDGRIMICGAFTSVNGVARDRIARLNADGSVDSTFDSGPGTVIQIRSMAIQQDGKIVIGGLFSAVGGAARSNIARLNTDGSIDPSFDPGVGANDTIRAVALQLDGKVIAAGDFRSAGGTTRNHAARFQNSAAAGSLPTITSSAPTSATAGQVYSYNVAATGYPAPWIQWENLPSWLAFDGASTISGTPQGGDLGTSGVITLHAFNTFGVDSRQFQISVQGLPPAITSQPGTLSVVAGSPWSYQVIASGVPFPGFSATGMPSWMSIDAISGFMSGIPGGVDVGTAGPIVVTASNGVAPNATQTFNVQVQGNAPVFYSWPATKAEPGKVYVYNVVTDGLPAPASSVTSQLPAWLSFDASAGVLSGTPSEADAPATVTVTLEALNGVPPNAVQTFAIEVRRPAKPAPGSSSGGCALSGDACFHWLLFCLALSSLALRSSKAEHSARFLQFQGC